MRPDVLIVGQGLAGSLLGWTLERAGIDFAIVDPGHETAATMAAAGIINPITGQRLVKSWRVDALLPLARSVYREIGDAIGAAVWREMRVRRLFAAPREREVFQAKRAAGELAPYVTGEREPGEEGFWIEGAARVDVGLLLERLRERWRAQGRLRVERADLAQEVEQHALVIDCTGLAALRRELFASVPWGTAKGETLELEVGGLAEDVILNRREWVAPMARGVAWVGATHEPGVTDPSITAAARQKLEGAARELIAKPFIVVGQRAGVRVTLPDKHPVTGRLAAHRRLGVLNGLGAKGALLAPWLAVEWLRHLQTGAAFDPAVDVARWRR